MDTCWLSRVVVPVYRNLIYYMSSLRCSVTSWDGAQIKVKQQVSQLQKPCCYVPTSVSKAERTVVSLETGGWMRGIPLPSPLSRCDSAPLATRGKRRKTCHPASQPGPRQPSSYVNVSACADSWVWHISLNMHVQHWLERKHPYVQGSVHLCARVCVFPGSQCVCLSWSWYVIVTFPVGRSLTTVFICQTAHISSWVQAGWTWHLISSTLSGVLSVCLDLILFVSLLLIPFPSENLCFISSELIYAFRFVWLLDRHFYRHHFGALGTRLFLLTQRTYGSILKIMSWSPSVVFLSI